MMEERRRAKRILCSVSLNYKTLIESEFHQSFDFFEQKRQRLVIYDRLVHDNKRSLVKLPTLEGEMQPYLKGLHDQLTLVVELFSMEFDALYKQKDSDVVISATGMRFHTHEKIKKGSMLEIQIRLEHTLQRMLVLAEVIASVSIKNKEGASTAVSFTFIDTADKEVLQEFVNEKNNN